MPKEHEKRKKKKQFLFFFWCPLNLATKVKENYICYKGNYENQSKLHYYLISSSLSFGGPHFGVVIDKRVKNNCLMSITNPSN